ncbi:unnamed protein product [Peronospora effusa]|nr:unnamed protein product [Peronospora effusa]
MCKCNSVGQTAVDHAVLSSTVTLSVTFSYHTYLHSNTVARYYSPEGTYNGSTLMAPLLACYGLNPLTSVAPRIDRLTNEVPGLCAGTLHLSVSTKGAIMVTVQGCMVLALLLDDCPHHRVCCSQIKDCTNHGALI